MNRVMSSLFIGIIFILVGVGLMADQFLPFEFGWRQVYPILFLALAVSSLFKVLSGHKQSAFGVGFFGCLGVFFFARNFGIIDSLWFFEWWPIVLLALGGGFLVSWLFHPADWGVLVPAFIFTALGSLFLLDSLDVVDDVFGMLWDLVDRYWPLVLVLIGISFILRSLGSNSRTAGKSEDAL